MIASSHQHRGSPWNLQYGIGFGDRQVSGEVTHNWIDGRQENTQLVPRGLALTPSLIFIADQPSPVFDRKTGANGLFEVPGARLLDGVTVAPDETVYVTDSAGGRSEPLLGSAVYQWKNGLVSRLDG